MTREGVKEVLIDLIGGDKSNIAEREIKEALNLCADARKNYIEFNGENVSEDYEYIILLRMIDMFDVVPENDKFLTYQTCLQGYDYWRLVGSFEC